MNAAVARAFPAVPISVYSSADIDYETGEELRLTSAFNDCEWNGEESPL